jgi:AAA domain
VSAPPLPTTHVAEIAARPPDQPWLVRSLWPASAVGLIGGPPKCAKTWLALDLALSVASDTPCLGALAVESPGPVLLYLAEDSLQSARARVEGLCTHRGLDLRRADLHLITAPTLRLDQDYDKQRLAATVEKLRPRLMLLDPFVRLHRSDENDSGAISAILADLRNLQRRFDVAVVLVHHARKNGRGPQGYALRGSGDLYAWGDAYAYLSRRDTAFRLALEHRSHAAIEPLALKLVSRADGSATRLEIAAEHTPGGPPSLESLAARELAEAGAVLTRAQLRARLRVNNQRLGCVLETLQRAGRVTKTPQGWLSATQ